MVLGAGSPIQNIDSYKLNLMSNKTKKLNASYKKGELNFNSPAGINSHLQATNLNVSVVSNYGSQTNLNQDLKINSDLEAIKSPEGLFKNKNLSQRTNKKVVSSTKKKVSVKRANFEQELEERDSTESKEARTFNSGRETTIG
mmetsp:Transcript_16644/g.25655  ORF Transcript_16644/g.25655 Transcript_16644/m.25655 type:complete len:143 (-) Transcript_16644:30-458(-)